MTAADESPSNDVRDDDLFLRLFSDLFASSQSDEASSMDLTLSYDNDSILSGTIFDSFTLKRNEAVRRITIEDDDEEEDDVMDIKNDATETQDQAIGNDASLSSSTSSSCHRRQRRGVRRGHQEDSFDSTSFSSATTFTVMTKTHDGSSSSSSRSTSISDLSTSLHVNTAARAA